MASKLKRTPEASIALSRELLENSTHVIVIAGAGMSADVGTPTYWTGDHAKYGDGTSRHGYTNLQHAMGPLWDKEPLNQAEFFQETFSEMLASPKPEDNENPYVLLKNWLDGREKKSFVLTSNVDTAFKEYGYDSAALYEIHGAYDRSQCLRVPSKHGVFPTVDPSQDKTYCPRCDSLARPNVLFFDDLDFNENVNNVQNSRFELFQDDINLGTTLILEVGVGLTVMNLRNMTRRLSAYYDLPVVRINPHHVNRGDHIPVGMSPIVEHPLTSIEGLKLLL